MYRYFVIALAVTAAATEGYAQNTIPGLVPGSTYTLTEPMTFDEARRFAVDNGGQLVVFDTAGEYDLVRNGLALNDAAWIGLSRPTGPQPWNWTWVNGTDLGQTHCSSCPSLAAPWDSGEPNNYQNGGETAVVMRPNGL